MKINVIRIKYLNANILHQSVSLKNGDTFNQCFKYSKADFVNEITADSSLVYGGVKVQSPVIFFLPIHALERILPSDPIINILKQLVMGILLNVDLQKFRELNTSEMIFEVIYALSIIRTTRT